MKCLEVKCKSCNEVFVIRKSEIQIYGSEKHTLPGYCPICRSEYRKKKKEEIKIHEDMLWKERKEQDYRDYERMLPKYHVVSRNDLKSVVDDRVLYVIGNGFDMMHGVKSSYYDFGRTIGKNSQLKAYLDDFLEVDDLWADFEGALAKINVKGMCSPYVIDTFLDTNGAYEEDAGAAEFFMSAEMAAGPIVSFNTDLRDRFRKWIEGLHSNTDDRPLSGIIKNGKVLNFNYTEFVETLYDVSESNICYIHGCRRKRKGFPKKELILGHMPGASDDYYNFDEMNYSGLDLSGNRAQMIYDAQQTTLQIVVDADNDLTKDCKIIIENHKDFFCELQDIDKVITIGHSLYPVDWDYFGEIINQNKRPGNISWYFGCHGKADLERIQKFIEHFGITEDRVYIFRTDLISVKLIDSANKEKSPNIIREKVLAKSNDGRWKVVSIEKRMEIRNLDDDKGFPYTRIFSSFVNGAVFLNDITIALVIKGVNEGIILLRFDGDSWNVVGELEEIPHQGVINRRLNRIILQDSKLVFIYNSRVRKYSIEDGTLEYNMPCRYEADKQYIGLDVTEKFLEIYKEGFH